MLEAANIMGPMVFISLLQDETLVPLTVSHSVMRLVSTIRLICRSVRDNGFIWVKSEGNARMLMSD